MVIADKMNKNNIEVGMKVQVVNRDDCSEGEHKGRRCDAPSSISTGSIGIVQEIKDEGSWPEIGILFGITEWYFHPNNLEEYWLK